MINQNMYEKTRIKILDALIWNQAEKNKAEEKQKTDRFGTISGNKLNNSRPSKFRNAQECNKQVPHTRSNMQQGRKQWSFRKVGHTNWNYKRTIRNVTENGNKAIGEETDGKDSNIF